MLGLKVNLNQASSLQSPKLPRSTIFLHSSPLPESASPGSIDPGRALALSGSEPPLHVWKQMTEVGVPLLSCTPQGGLWAGTGQIPLGMAGTCPSMCDPTSWKPSICAKHFTVVEEGVVLRSGPECGATPACHLSPLQAQWLSCPPHYQAREKKEGWE